MQTGSVIKWRNVSSFAFGAALGSASHFQTSRDFLHFKSFGYFGNFHPLCKWLLWTQTRIKKTKLWTVRKLTMKQKCWTSPGSNLLNFSSFEITVNLITGLKMSSVHSLFSDILHTKQINGETDERNNEESKLQLTAVAGWAEEAGGLWQDAGWRTWEGQRCYSALNPGKQILKEALPVKSPVIRLLTALYPGITDTGEGDVEP